MFFLYIFALFKHKFYSKNCWLQRDSNSNHYNIRQAPSTHSAGLYSPKKIMFFKWANPGLFLFTFVHFKHKFYSKNCWLQQDSNSDHHNMRQAHRALDSMSHKAHSHLPQRSADSAVDCINAEKGNFLFFHATIHCGIRRPLQLV